MTAVLHGRRRWSGSRDAEGHREYKLLSLVRHDPLDGPNVVMNAPGLALPGSFWSFGNDIDIWAFCLPTMTVSPAPGVKENQKYKWSVVEQTFSTKPPQLQFQRCNDTNIEDPLLEPPKISGSFVKYQEEATHDRFGNPILTSSWEQLRGAQVEFDSNRPQVVISQNVPVLDLALFSSMVDCVNDAPMWGVDRRMVKLSDAKWERKYYGTCYVYYTRTMTFDINFLTFDRDLLDEGTKCLRGQWNKTTGLWDLIKINGADPDPTNPTHFDRYKDKNYENARVILDGGGKPYVPVNLRAASATVSKGGTGYVINDILTLTGGTFTEAATFRVMTVGLGEKWFGIDDAVMTVSLNTPGVYSVRPTNPVATTGAGDNGCKLNVQWRSFDGRVGSVHVEKYREANFFALGIPSTL